MAGQGKRQVILSNPAAIVTHPQQLDPSLLDIDVDTLGTGIQTVLQQFLDDRGWTLHNLTRRDLVSQSRA